MTAETPAKPYLSASQIELYCKCPHAYSLYLEAKEKKEKQRSNLAQIRGSATHAAAAENFKQKVSTHQDIPQSDFVDFAIADFDGRLSSGFILTKEEESIGTGKVVGRARDDIADLARFHIRNQAPEYDPAFVEETIRVEMPGSHDLLGIMDLATTDLRVVDFKTSKMNKSQHEADQSPQLTIYAVCHHAKTGQPPTEVALDVTVNTAKGVNRQYLKSSRGPADFAALAHRIDTIARAIAAGIFPPATVGAWWCSPKMCPHWRNCPFVNSERASAAQE